MARLWQELELLQLHMEQQDVYERLGQFGIEKDRSGYLKFSESFSLSCIDDIKKVS